MNKFFKNWTSHGKKLKSDFMILYNYFIIVLVDENLFSICYSGPPETLGIGICLPGNFYCKEGIWGSDFENGTFMPELCMDEVVPMDEDICNGEDTNCDGITEKELEPTDILLIVDMSGSKQSEKSQSYMREEMAATAEKSGKNPDIARGMVDEELSFEFLVIEGDTLQVDDIEGRKDGKLITLTTELAIKYGIADGKGESIEDVLSSLQIEDYEIVTVDENWSENVVRILTNPTVSSLLTTFGTIGVISELYSAGLGIGGTIGIICLTLALGAGYLTQLASSTDILVVLLGLILLFVEAIAIPGFGVFGITGIVVLFYGLYLLLIPDVPVSPEIYSEALDGFGWAIVVGIFGIIFILRLIGKSAFFQKLVSSDSNKTTLKKNFKNRSKVE